MTAVTLDGLDVDVVRPLSIHTSERVYDEAAAVKLAREWVGPNQSQVTITARTTDPACTFAVRHLTWENGQVRDWGWRVWIDSVFRAELSARELPWAVDQNRFVHAFRTPFGIPPDKGDTPICGATLTDAYDFPGTDRPPCPACQQVADAEGVRFQTPCEHCGSTGSYVDSADDSPPARYCGGCGLFFGPVTRERAEP